VFSRYLVIVIAFGVAVFQAWRGAWMASAGLFGLSGGLIVLKIAEARPRIRPLAYVGFALTAAAVVAVLRRWV